MFSFQDISSSPSKVHQKRNMIKAAATHDDLPLIANVDWAERWCTLQNEFKDVCEDIHNFEVRNDDVFVVTFMKCGTTWMQELCWLLTHQLDFQQAREVNLSQRSRFLELASLWPKGTNNSIERLNEAPSPRVMKSHLPMNLLPKQLWQKREKIVFVARNVKDVIVSSFHFITGVGLWDGTLEEYLHDFMNDEVHFAPYWAQVAEFWQLRHEPNIFFVTFEEMKRDLTSVIRRLCTFLERPQLTAQEMQAVEQHVSFDNMKKTKTTNITNRFRTSKFELKEDFEFMRSGTVGSYKADLSAESEKMLNDWTSECLAKYGITEEDIFGKL